MQFRCCSLLLEQTIYQRITDLDTNNNISVVNLMGSLIKRETEYEECQLPYSRFLIFTPKGVDNLLVIPVLVDCLLSSVNDPTQYTFTSNKGQNCMHSTRPMKLYPNWTQLHPGRFFSSFYLSLSSVSTRPISYPVPSNLESTTQQNVS